VGISEYVPGDVVPETVTFMVVGDVDPEVRDTEAGLNVAVGPDGNTV
jgi:hypothetical protein